MRDNGAAQIGGWVIVEAYERDGFQYRVVRRDLANALTKREHEILLMVCARLTNKEIARQLNVSPSTIGVLISRAAGKLGVQGRSDLRLRYSRLVERDRSAEGTPDLEP